LGSRFSFDPSQILSGVDVVGAAGIAAFHDRDQVRVRPQERSCSRVPGRHLQHRGPVLRGDQHRVARLAAVGRDGDGGPGPVRGDQPPHRFRSDERLIGQRDHGRPGSCFCLDACLYEGAQPGGQRGTHPGAPVRVVHRPGPGHGHGHGAGHDQHRIGAAGGEQRHAALGEGLPGEFDRGLRPSQP
jgi:hypothetical protein